MLFSKHATALLSILSIVFLVKCQINTSNSDVEASPYAEGKSLADKYCVACHAASGGSMRVAPPLFAVRKHYINAFDDEADFIDAMVDFIRHPDTSKSLMPKAVKSFGLMPGLSYSEEKLRAIAEYLYHEEPPAPKKHKEKHGKHKKAKGEPTDEVIALAMQTKKALGNQLMQAIESDGAAAAVDFCHIEAMPITDSMSKLLGVTIRRVSDRSRNQANAADEHEVRILRRMHRQMEKRGQAKAVSDTLNGLLRHYVPIVTNSMCLQCHGNPDEHINKKTFDAIAARYPNDHAIGYDVEQIRGMFVVEEQ